MILKNCRIYSEIDDVEKNVDIFFTSTIESVNDTGVIDYSGFISKSISDLTFDVIEEINRDSSKYVIDINGMFVIPGGIDPHVHFFTPGYPHKEEFYLGSCSAAKGGVTTVIDMHCTSIPMVTSGANFDYKLELIKSESVIDFGFYGGIDCREFDNYNIIADELASKGVKGFKAYFVSGMDTYPMMNKLQFLQLCQKAKELDIPVLLHAEDYELLSKLAIEHKDDKDDYVKYCNIRPELGEVLAVATAVEIAKFTGCKLHVVHVASADAAKILNAAKTENITYETCPHYLKFTQDDFITKGSSLKTAPVTKKKYDKDLLWEFLISGECPILASDHAPATFEEKNTGVFSTDYGGIPGTQTMIPFLFSEGLLTKKLTLKTFTNAVSTNAAKRFGMYPRKGCIVNNSDADFAILNLEGSKVFKGEDLLSKGKITPFENEVFNGTIELTIVRGKIVYSNIGGIEVDKGYGLMVNGKITATIFNSL